MSVTPKIPTATPAFPHAPGEDETTTLTAIETDPSELRWIRCTTLDDCYRGAQITGMALPLCFPDSPFLNDFDTCRQCVESEVANLGEALYMVYEAMGSFLEYCEKVGTLSSYPQSLLTTAIRTQIFVITDLAGAQGQELIEATILEVRPGIFLPQATSLSASPSISQPDAKSTSQPAEPTDPAAPMNTGETSLTRDITWVAGALIGGTSIVLFFAAGLWFLRRRRKQKAFRSNAVHDNRGYEKPQLHSDCIPRQPAIELEGSYPNAMPEIGANEVAAQELLSSELRSPVEIPERQT
ncbi:hypothetical protein CCHR01_17965 [Colletotrichum chrysophilum]|uniref:Uncharacterized protein n=1 Tax=Colletotrichum chrysophilum TaxID=1836956 RepID=A0AAD9A3A9_9PEZI|nr:hypothetical protein CCHR01_17965 [Colletotrichum chrysophilum]